MSATVDAEPGYTVGRPNWPYGHSTVGAANPWVHLIESLLLDWAGTWHTPSLNRATKAHCIGPSGRPVVIWGYWQCGRCSQVPVFHREVPPESLPCPDCFGLREAAPSGPFVYYAERARSIKIGTALDPHRRARALRAELLAVEPGDRALEGFRHSQFSRLQVAGEWFRPDEVLLAHIERLAVAS